MLYLVAGRSLSLINTGLSNHWMKNVLLAVTDDDPAADG